MGFDQVPELDGVLIRFLELEGVLIKCLELDGVLIKS
jgi:hypothetical protein